MKLPLWGDSLPPSRKVRCTASTLLLGACLVLADAGPALAASLQGSMASVRRQSRVAREHDFTLLRSSSDVQRFVDLGLLVRVYETDCLRLEGVSYPYARPEVKLFLERLSRQYASSCGEPLVVTSLVRPRNEQPRNASSNSVHPTGMAIDIRRSNSRASRRWLEKNLLVLEDRGVLEATRERRPPHYHVAVFPRPYADYVERKTGRNVRSPSQGETVTAQAVDTKAEDSVLSQEQTYQVQNGDSLWVIAQKFGTSVGNLRRANDLRSSRIYPGQTLLIPGN